MTEFKRDFFRVDPVLSKLYEFIKQNHRVADHTQRVLFENRTVKDFCQEARHFVVLSGNKALYIHYDVSSWWKDPAGVHLRIDSIGVYDDFIEYETARLRGLHSGNKSDIPNIN